MTLWCFGNGMKVHNLSDVQLFLTHIRFSDAGFLKDLGSFEVSYLLLKKRLRCENMYIRSCILE